MARLQVTALRAHAGLAGAGASEPAAEELGLFEAGGSSRRRDCHSADAPSPSLLKHLLQGEGGAPE